MNIKYIIFILFILLCSLQSLDAQIKPSVHFTEDDGLASNMVKNAILDKNGILWVATENGISKYDGNSFESLNKTNGLPSNRVWCLAVDENNTIYAGCYQSGLAVIRNDSVIRVLHFKGRYSDTYRKLYYSDYYKKLLVGTHDGIFILSNNRLIPVSYNKDTAYNSIITSITEEGSKIFFSVLKGSSSGLYQLFLNSRFPEKSYTKKVSSTWRFPCMLAGNTLYTGYYNSIFRHKINEPWQPAEKIHADTSFFVWCMKPYKDEKFWVGGLGDGRFRGDIMLYDTRTNRLQPSGIKQNIQTVNSIFYDPSSDVTWFARDNGLTAYRETPFEYTEFNGKGNILDIGFAGDSLLILTENGVFYVRKGVLIQILTKNQITTRITNEWDKGVRQYGKKFQNMFDIAGGCEFASLSNESGKLFLNTAKGAISIPDLKTYVPFAVGVYKLLPNGNAYAAVNYWPLRYYASSRKIDFVYPKDRSGNIENVFKIIESNGVCYFATQYDGLIAIRNNNVYRLTQPNLGSENGLTDMDKDVDGTIWCSSSNGEVFRVEFREKLLVKKEIDLTVNGLYGNTIKWIKFHGRHLYIGTNKGLNVITKRSLNSEHPSVEGFFNKFNGYDFVSAISPVTGADGKLYVHTLNEVVSIDTNFMRGRLGRLDIYMARINDNKADIEAFSGKALPYSTNQISFLFRAIKYPSSRNMTYRFKINNEGWVSGNQVNLQSLRIGDYQVILEVTDKENNSILSDTISFSIQKPFWLTYGFIFLVLVVVSALITALIRRRIRLLKKRNDEKTKLLVQNSELQLRSLQLQMNPHFIFNALTTMQNFILSKNVADALIFLNNLSSIIRTNLENASEEYTFLTEEIEFLKKYVQIELIRFKGKLQVEFINTIDDPNLLIPPMLIQPLIENAIKHGVLAHAAGGKVSIEFIQKADSVVVIVEDNGVGRAAAEKMRSDNSKHLGLSIIRNRLILMNEINLSSAHSIEFIDLFSDGIPAGTRVIVSLALVTS